jgi:glycosyltransferase involved in cell wall biosynthesis
MKEAGINIVQRIINGLLLHSSFIDNLGLLNGKMGVSIFFYHLSRKTGNTIYAVLTDGDTLRLDMDIMAQRIISLLQHEKERERIGQSGRWCYLERYTAEKMCERMLICYGRNENDTPEKQMSYLAKKLT